MYTQNTQYKLYHRISLNLLWYYLKCTIKGDCKKLPLYTTVNLHLYVPATGNLEKGFPSLESLFLQSKVGLVIVLATTRYSSPVYAVYIGTIHITVWDLCVGHMLTMARGNSYHVWNYISGVEKSNRKYQHNDGGHS